MYAVLATGDHVTLPRAELEAQLGPATWLGDRIAKLDAPLADIRRLAYLKEAIEYWAEAPDSEAGVAELVAALDTDGAGSIAVDVVRTGHEKSAHRELAQREIGGALAAAGHPIDLRAPDHVVAVWSHGGRLVMGRRVATGQQRFEARAVEQRAHFSPVSLNPRTALALVHLTGCRPGATLYDPFCGTGGIALEAALDGYDVLASDIDPWMVQGTLQTLADAGPEPLDGDAFIADIGDAADLAPAVDGIATDLPYGTASSSQKEDLGRLYGRAFATFAALLPAGGRAVIGHKDADLLASVEAHGFTVEAVHEQFAHKSLTRRFAVVRRLG